MTRSLDELRQHLYAAVVCDALDKLGYQNQSPRVGLRPFTGEDQLLVGRCKTTLWAEMWHTDPSPYELELRAVDECRQDEVLIAAAGGSLRSGIWGELLTTAAKNGGCVGAIVDGAVRDVAKIASMQFPVYARATCVYDSQNRQRVIDIDVPVEIGGVVFSAGDLVVADRDGIVVIPQAVESATLDLAWEKIHGENRTRQAIREGMKAGEVYRKYGIL